MPCTDSSGGFFFLLSGSCVGWVWFRFARCSRSPRLWRPSLEQKPFVSICPINSGWWLGSYLGSSFTPPKSGGYILLFLLFTFMVSPFTFIQLTCEVTFNRGMRLGPSFYFLPCRESVSPTSSTQQSRFPADGGTTMPLRGPTCGWDNGSSLSHLSVWSCTSYWYGFVFIASCRIPSS